MENDNVAWAIYNANNGEYTTSELVDGEKYRVSAFLVRYGERQGAALINGRYYNSKMFSFYNDNMKKISDIDLYSSRDYGNDVESFEKKANLNKFIVRGKDGAYIDHGSYRTSLRSLGMDELESLYNANKGIYSTVDQAQEGLCFRAFLNRLHKNGNFKALTSSVVLDHENDHVISFEDFLSNEGAYKLYEKINKYLEISNQYDLTNDKDRIEFLGFIDDKYLELDSFFDTSSLSTFNKRILNNELKEFFYNPYLVKYFMGEYESTKRSKNGDLHELTQEFERDFKEREEKKAQSMYNIDMNSNSNNSREIDFSSLSTEELIQMLEKIKAEVVIRFDDVQDSANNGNVGRSR